MTSGDVVLLNFPFSDLSGAKLRPAVVIAAVGKGDLIACQITSNRDADKQAIELTARSFSGGGLRTTSFTRPGKLFTAHRSLIARRVGRLKGSVSDNVRNAVIRVIQSG